MDLKKHPFSYKMKFIGKYNESIQWTVRVKNSEKSIEKRGGKSRIGKGN